MLQSNACPEWIRIATEIELNYKNFDAFVVLSGTDTICYRKVGDEGNEHGADDDRTARAPSVSYLRI